MAIIYQATNLINGKRYIGRTGQALGSRVSQHFNAAQKRKRGHFNNSLNKYGRGGFRWSVLLKCDASEVSAHEVRLIACLRPEYNSKRKSSGKPTVDKWKIPPMPHDWCLEGETWRCVPGCPPYQVSSIGRVRKLETRYKRSDGLYATKYARIMKLGKKKRSSHRVICLQVNGIRTTFQVHRLVALAFIGPCPSGLNVLHRNDVGDDNSPDNLYYGTQQQNVADRCRNGKTARGVQLSPLSEEDVKEIKRRHGIETQRSLARRFKVSHTSIWQIQVGKTWNHIEV